MSPPSPFQYSDQRTIYDVIYANDNPPQFYGDSHLIQTGACSHLAKLKQKYKQVGDDENHVFENYRTLVRYSMSWHKSRKQRMTEQVGKKRKYTKELPLPQCSSCSDPLSRLHPGLHFNNMAMDFDRYTIFCYECNDYVYDLEIDEKITKTEIVSSRSRRKKHHAQFTPWEPTEQEVSVINCMCCEMNDLFTQLYSGDKQPYGPCRFLQSTWMSQKELAGYAQQDAHEFFISALNNIHAGCEGHKLSNCDLFYQEATKQLSIKRIPPVLSIQLKRFEHGTSTSKIETKIRFPIELDLTPYTTSKKRSSDNIYTLFAVVNHQGKVDTGHYTMFAKHRNEWFKFDDHNVAAAYQKDVLDSKAYMCFYIQKSLKYMYPDGDNLDLFRFE
ncbi:hypothetical protein G6F59_001478 [Rhizopus arrhizus]|nr:hypothetical protein G6F59_001478 [Rhizopus arrhizus]